MTDFDARDGRRDMEFANYSTLRDVLKSRNAVENVLWRLSAVQVDWWEKSARPNEFGELFHHDPTANRRGRRLGASYQFLKYAFSPNELVIPLEFSYCAYILSEELQAAAANSAAVFSLGVLSETSSPPTEPNNGTGGAKSAGRPWRDLPPHARSWQQQNATNLATTHEAAPYKGSATSSTLGASSDDPSQSDPIRVLTPGEAENQQLLYLFNVIVALEWVPDAEDYRQLVWAFRRASDYLYDVSDGTLAFGQVIIGWGDEYMQVADIQIAASNRMQGRAWVGGMHEQSKHRPIRLGRGEWRRTYSIPWDEPEGYRVIVHEWAHYALHLRDAYLERYQVAPGTNTLVRPNAQQGSATNGRQNLLVPKPYLLGLSILETIDGVSELSINFSPHSGQRPFSDESKLLSVLYPSARRVKGKLQNGPGALPLPFPQIVLRDNAEPADNALEFPAMLHHKVLNIRPFEPNAGDTTRVPFDRCWLYVYRAATKVHPAKFVAQGTLDSRAQVQSFRLLGAEPGDQLLAVVYDFDYCPVTFVGPADKILFNLLPKAAAPRIEVLPQSFASTTPLINDELPQKIQLRVRLRDDEALKQPDSVWLCPMGGQVQIAEKPELSEASPATELLYTFAPVDALDGHVVLWYGQTPVVCGYSHGGNPPRHVPTAPSEARFADLPIVDAPDTDTLPLAENGTVLGVAPEPSTELLPVPFVPITAGSFDGNVRIYFEVLDAKQFKLKGVSTKAFNNAYSKVRVITTIQSSLTTSRDDGAVPLTYPFTISSNASLRQPKLPAVSASLEVRFTPPDIELAAGRPTLFRLKADKWHAVPTIVLTSFGTAVAAVLDDDSLLYSENGTDLAEHYQLWWLPEGNASGANKQDAHSSEFQPPAQSSGEVF